MNRALLLLALAAGLVGCASPYRKPCTVAMTFTLDTDQSVDNYCKERVALLDDGTAPDWQTTYRGCANAPRATIHAREDEETWGHEVKHVLDYHCRKKIAVGR